MGGYGGHRVATGVPVEVRAQIMALSKATLAEVLWDVLCEYESDKSYEVLVAEILRRDRLLVQVR